jgi:hypothetical protein
MARMMDEPMVEQTVGSLVQCLGHLKESLLGYWKVAPMGRQLVVLRDELTGFWLDWKSVEYSVGY